MINFEDYTIQYSVFAIQMVLFWYVSDETAQVYQMFQRVRTQAGAEEAPFICS